MVHAPQNSENSSNWRRKVVLLLMQLLLTSAIYLIGIRLIIEIMHNQDITDKETLLKQIKIGYFMLLLLLSQSKIKL